jgi:AraC-like DNA-binding protein/ActR/RegA family two-component response regulator
MDYCDFKIFLISDSRSCPDKDELLQSLNIRWPISAVSFIRDTNTVSDVITQISPGLICYDLDYPHKSGLQQIQTINSLFSDIPVMLLSHVHSEELALWALRNRIWDIQYKPIDLDVIQSNIIKLIDIDNNNTSYKDITLPFVTKNELFEKPSTRIPKVRTQPAIEFVCANYTRNITLKEVSRLCFLSPRTFSDQFKQEHGISFKNYLIQYRIGIARTLIDSGKYDSIIKIAYDVGFNDHSYFSRIFRHYTGLTPSQYRNSTIIHNI